MTPPHPYQQPYTRPTHPRKPNNTQQQHPQLISYLLLLLQLLPSAVHSSLILQPQPAQQTTHPKYSPPTGSLTAHLPLNTAPTKPYSSSSSSHHHHHPSHYPTNSGPAQAQPSQPATALLPSHHHQQQHVLQKRAPNWTTVTVFVNTVTAYADAPTVVTVTMNGTDQMPGKAGTATVTVGAFTQTIGQGLPNSQPATSTHTVVLGPPPTSSTTTTTSYSPVASSTPSSPSDNSHPDQLLPKDRPCSPGEASERYPGTLSLTRPTQTTTLLVMALYLLVMLVCWNLFLVRYLIFPLKLVIISWHELGHIVVSVFGGRKIEEVSIDPSIGGSVKLVDEFIPAAAPLFAGYLSSCLFGGLMVFCGFDTLASKIASIFIAMSLIGVMWWANSITSKVLTVAALGVLVAFWFIDHAGMLRYYVLLMGVLSCWYVIFDVMDDFVFRKLNPCCPILFEQRWPKITAPQWSMIWILYSGINFAAWVLLAIAVWRQTRTVAKLLVQLRWEPGASSHR
ncbi:hypothetical protein PGT21_027696 [Puccinia graminis f. sp. tritici]|uniref:Uncharacterized protein n=1 Tax=Puccinia graminis f. sp. tritici TaxID=56615 RepID=A0A5B0PKV7_PUCGR|nr:hypothetical protein PGT21_027696 [Puccinia graminis f. sp. tritici]